MYTLGSLTYWKNRSALWSIHMTTTLSVRINTDTKKRLPDRGGIALQMHGGGDYTKQFVRYRHIRVKVLD